MNKNPSKIKGLIYNILPTGNECRVNSKYLLQQDVIGLSAAKYLGGFLFLVTCSVSFSVYVCPLSTILTQTFKTRSV